MPLFAFQIVGSPTQGGVKTRCGPDYGLNFLKILAKIGKFLGKCFKNVDFTYQGDIQLKF